MFRPFAIVATLVAMTLGFCQPAQAQKAIEPTIEVRMRSINDLLDKVGYLGDIINQGEQAKQGVEFIRSIADEKKGIEGIDPTKPIGMYGTVTKDVIDSQVILMIPVADEKAFLDLLTGKLNLEPKKGDDDRYELKIPNVPLPIYFRYTKGYVYATAGSSSNLDDKKLFTPKDFFRADFTAIATADIHVDRIPDDIKKTVFAQLELQLNDAKNQKIEGEPPIRTQSRILGTEQTARAIQTILKDGRKLSLQVNLEPKSDDIALALRFTANNGTELSKSITGMKGQTVNPALSEKAPLGLAVTKLSLPDGAMKSFQAVFDFIQKDAVASAPEKDKALTKLAVEAITPTLRAGKFESTLFASARDNDGKGTLFATLNVVDGKAIENALKQAVNQDNPKDQVVVSFDAKKVGDLTFHKITLKDPAAKESLGSDTIWLGFSDTQIVAQVTPDGKLNEALLKPTTTTNSRHLQAELSIAGLFTVTEKALKANKVQELITDVFGKTGPSGKDTLTLSIDGGDALTMRVSMKGKAMKLAVMIDQEKKK